MQRLRDIIALADLPFSLSLVFFWRTAVLLFSLSKVFSSLTVNSTTTSLAENGWGTLYRRAQYISELAAPLLDPLYLVFLALLRSIFGPSLPLHFWKRNPPKPNPTKLQLWPASYDPVLALGE